MEKKSVKERRDKLIEQFELMIQDKQKMDQLEGLIFNMLQTEKSSLSEAQWTDVEERDAASTRGDQTGTKN